MSLKCSLFGCKWGETEVEREREEDGSEVVTTIRETETCKRCGDVRVVSENKEVTTLETAADIVADDLQDEPKPAEPDQSTTPAGDPSGGPEPDAGEAPDQDGTAIPDAESDDAVVTTDAGATDHPEVDESPPSDVEDDAVILDDEAEQADAPSDDDEDDGERSHGEWPEEPSDDDDWEQPTEIEPTVDESHSEFGSVGNAVTVPEGEFFCPECEYSTPVEESSLREGDYCPECHRGSLEHRTE